MLISWITFLLDCEVCFQVRAVFSVGSIALGNTRYGTTDITTTGQENFADNQTLFMSEFVFVLLYRARADKA